VQSEAGFLVEDFLDAVSAQLDRTQDALAAKAKVRPMTFALRQFAIDLQVFVSMGPDGNVRLRSAAPGETGASTLKLDFTTITRPMIEENTVSLAMAQSPTLAEVGLKPEEQQQLERVGVRTVAQLQALRASGAGIDGISRLTGGIPVDRLREALRFGRPQVYHVAPVGPGPAPEGPSTPAPAPAPAAPPEPTHPVVSITPGTHSVLLAGRGFLTHGVPPTALLNGRPLATETAEDDRLVVKLPGDDVAGTLEIDLGDDEPLRYRLEPATEPVRAGNGSAHDAWSAGGDA